MKRKLIQTILIFGLLPLSCTVSRPPTEQVFADAYKQTDVLLQEVALAKRNATKAHVFSPRTLSPKGELELVASGDWTSGFFPGTLWYLYEYSQDPKWLAEARRFTALMEAEQWNGKTHDMGFKVFDSYGHGYRLTQDPAYKAVIIQAAKTLSTRFNPKTGLILSWDHSRHKWDNPVIIDNLMNLELLFEATKMTGDSSFYKIAVSHADKTILNHFRSDYSSYHVVDYNPQTGEVLKKTTHQGFANHSAWARGQAWALYGYTLCYRETKDPRYLAQAEHIAAFLFAHKHMPKDLIPYWDFDAADIPNEPRDASAAAVIASGLYELSGYSKNKKNYKKLADKILVNLTNQYRSTIGEHKGFLLMHSTGAKPSNIEVDVPLNYADYYYLEALLRQKAWVHK